ncbi:uncharacterized protein ACOB7L_027659 isoform 1-T2 [Callospermophilus lateralis]|uniref:uncharacterized protein LOC143380643 n=1 Tax=Callospermophilus lateralis TaxID=76772 RepID=UPI0040539797
MKKDQIDPAKKADFMERCEEANNPGFPNTSRPRRKQDPNDDGSNSNCPTGLSGWRVFRTKMQKLQRVNRCLIFAKRKGEYVGSHSHMIGQQEVNHEGIPSGPGRKVNGDT